jgi:hypothetical protein
MKLRGMLLVGMAGAVLVAGCEATVGTGGIIVVPRDAASRCVTICSDIGTTLNAVVVMAGNVGCVCNPPSAHAQADDTSGRQASAAGGMTAIILAEEAQRQAQRRR